MATILSNKSGSFNMPGLSNEAETLTGVYTTWPPIFMIHLEYSKQEA